MNIVHLTASTFFGGPERQMLGLAEAMAQTHQTTVLTFAERGRCRPLLTAARRRGIEALPLAHDTPRLRAAAGELTGLLDRVGADLLCCHGYKADLLGRVAARRRGIPVVAVSRGWTGENIKVRLYETLDRLHLRWMDRVVCVSRAQAAKVRRAGTPAARTHVIPNAVDPSRFGDPDPVSRAKLLRLFRRAPERLVGAAGRLSPEKGFDVLLDAAAHVVQHDRGTGFVIFGDGPLRADLLAQARAAGLAENVVLAGFRADLDRFLPVLDLFVLPSYTEGMPNVVLEAFAAGAPVVATAAGGTGELVEDRVTGMIVPPGDHLLLADAIAEALASGDLRRDLKMNARQRVLENFTFVAQAERYRRLFAELAAPNAEPIKLQQPNAFSVAAEPAKVSEDIIAGVCGTES